MDHNGATYYHVFGVVIFSISFSTPFLNHHLQNAVNRVPSNGFANTFYKLARINGARSMPYSRCRSVPVKKGRERVDEREKC